MDLFSFAPVAALLDAAYVAVEGLATLFDPIAGTGSAALAVLALTLLVRVALIPVGISQVKAEWTRRRLAPRLRELQRKYKKKPQLLQQKTMALYKAEHASPLAGILPTLAQAPVLSLVYGLFVRSSIDGHANALLTEHLFRIPLGTSFAQLLANGALIPGGAVFAVLFLVLAATALMSRRVTLRLAVSPAEAVAPSMKNLGAVLSWLPLITVVFAAVVPLAATLYLTTTTAWTLAERGVLRRMYWREASPGDGTATVVAT